MKPWDEAYRVFTLVPLALFCEAINYAFSLFYWLFWALNACSPIKMQWIMCYILFSQEKFYADNIEASVDILRKLSEEWKILPLEQSSLQSLGETLRSFRQKVSCTSSLLWRAGSWAFLIDYLTIGTGYILVWRWHSCISIASVQNEKALTGGVAASRGSCYREADKYCKALLGKVSNGHSCMKTLTLTIVVVAVGAVVISPSLNAWDWNKLPLILNTQTSFWANFDLIQPRQIKKLC